MIQLSQEHGISDKTIYSWIRQQAEGVGGNLAELGKLKQDNKALLAIELFLVQEDPKGYYTNFHGHIKHSWPDELNEDHNRILQVASNQMLINYRTNYEKLKGS